MLFGPLQHVIVRRRLVLEIVGLHVVLAHGVVLEFIPHQQAAQIGMAGKDDAVEIEDFALLKLRRAPDGRERRQLDLVGAICCAHAEDDRTVLFGDREEVIDSLKIAGLDTLARLVDGFFDLLLDTVDGLRDGARHFYFFADLLVEPVDAGDVGEEIEGQFRIVAQKLRDLERLTVREQQRVLPLTGWGWR